MRRRYFAQKYNANKYLTITALSDEVAIKFSSSCFYKIDNSDWALYEAGCEVKIDIDSAIYFKGNLISNGQSGIGGFTISGSCKLAGNCLSMLYFDEADKNSQVSTYAFSDLFANCKSIVSVSNNFLSATTLESGCYRNMFYGCTSLVNAPELPATTLADDCYEQMFYGCSKLNYIKMLATDISATYCLEGWVSGVASSGTFVKNSAMTSLPTGVSGIPSGWTVVNDGSEGEGESEWAFSFNIEVAQGESWIANPEQLVQINKVFAIVTKFLGLEGGDFSHNNAPPEFDLRINGERNFSFYYNSINNESDEISLYISMRHSDAFWITHSSFPWNNPVVDSFTLIAA